MYYAYPYDMSHEPDGGLVVTFADVPGAVTQAATEADAAIQAVDALLSLLASLVQDGLPIPRPSAARGRPVSVVPALESAKLALHDAMLRSGITNVELGRRLNIDERAVRRMRNLLHRSHIGQLETALGCLGKRIDVRVREAA